MSHEFERRLPSSSITETQQLAAELHDGLGQDLAGISLLLAALRRTPHAQYPDVQEPIANIAGLMVQAMVSCRRVSEGFGAFLVRQHGITAALLHYASQFEDENTHIEFHGCDIPVSLLEETTSYYLFGIGREAICNAFRHSHAKTIHVTCDHVDDSVLLIIKDDGVGLASTATPDRGIGRSIMEFRARSIGATLSFTTAPAGGVRVECRIACAPDSNR